jgi:hypothetical protein
MRTAGAANGPPPLSGSRQSRSRVAKVDIPYQDTSLPGYFFKPDCSGAACPTLILNNGSDGPITCLWPTLGAGGTARGYNVLVFDGPGQQSMLFERNVPFRYDWEQVITPVVDFLSGRPDVDHERIALFGPSQAGYWVPRALAFEHRIAAAIADPGIVDSFEPWWNALPAPLRHCLDVGDKQAFDQLMQAGMQQAPAASARTGSGGRSPTAFRPHTTCSSRRGAIP